MSDRDMYQFWQKCGTCVHDGGSEECTDCGDSYENYKELNLLAKPKTYTQSDLDEAVRKALDKVNDAFSHLHGEEKITVGEVWDVVNNLKSQIGHDE